MKAPVRSDVADVTAEDVLRRSLGHDVARLLTSDPIARAGVDAEGVHQMRVATRRLRAELGVAGTVLKARPVTSMRRELRWLGAILGAQRDVDVLARRLAASPDIAPRVARSIDRSLDRDRRRARRAIDDALASGRYLALVETMAQVVIRPPLRRNALRSAFAMLLEPLGRESARLDGLVGGLGPSPSITELHAVRIATKRLRYSVEMAIGVVPGATTALVALLGDVQDVLGELHDASQTISYLEKIRSRQTSWTPSSPEDDSVLALEGAQRAAIEHLRRLWRPPYELAHQALVTAGWASEGLTPPS